MKRLRGEGADSTGASGRSGTPQRLASRSIRGVLALSTAFGSEALRAAGFRGARARDFEDFVSGDRGLSAGLVPLPDPAFREGLRRRLGRIQVLARHGRGRTSH